MSLITVINVSLHFLDRPIFRDTGFQVELGERIGLVGPNGAGKTTLLRLLNGEINPDTGEVRLAKAIRIGYLPQDVQETLSGPVLQSIIDSIPGRVDLHRKIGKLEKSLKGTDQQSEQARLAENLADLHQEMNHLDGEFPRHEAEKILFGLGFQTDDFQRPVSTLSGGWKMRAALASLLYRKPDLLLLDEPTNHLDIPSVRWLETYLQEFRGALILVSHDRDFLNRQVNRIISFEPEDMKFYSGNYDFFLKASEEETKILEAKARRQEQKIKEAQKFIDRFRAKASKARQAQSKIKLVKKMELVKTRLKEKTIRFSFPDAPRSGRVVLSIEGVSKAFGQNLLYGDLELNVLRGDRIAIIGPNGCGKTTLLRMVAGEVSPDKGKINLGHEVHMGYFAQHHADMLNPRKTIIQEVYQAVPQETIGFVRSVCGAFLFSGKDVDKAIGVLSGGERARVSLAKLLVKPGNLMVMDEPTNHLDITSSEKLIDALEKYKGTLLFVSHNQSFVNRLATKIWDINNGEVTEYHGILDEYYEHLSKLEGERTEPGGPLGKNQVVSREQDFPPKKKQDRKAEKKARAERRRLIHDTLKPIRMRLEETEKIISDLEMKQKDLEQRLADPEIFKDTEKSVPLLNEYHETRATLDGSLLEWERLQEELASAKLKLGIQDNGDLENEEEG